MSSTLRTILIIAVFALVTIWLFYEPSAPATRGNGNGNGSGSSEEMTEGYDNSVTDHNVEPDDYIHSHGVRFMPHLTDRDETLTDVDFNSFRVHDHTDEQRDGEAFEYNCEKEPTLKYNDRGQEIRDVTPDTSLQRACQQGDRVTDSNDINGVCSKQTLLTNDIYAFSDEIHEVAPRMDMTRDEHHSLVAMRPHMKTFIEVDQSAGDFNAPVRKQDLPFEELKDTVNRYRNDTLKGIRNGYEHNASIRQKYPYYDGVQ
jgi:hypothetical protein